MELDYLPNAAAHVALNPVKAKMVKSAWGYRWSSVHAHIKGKDPQEIVAMDDEIKERVDVIWGNLRLF